MLRVLHVLPHRGGGAETYLDVLERIEDVEHERVALSAGPTPAAAARSLAPHWLAVARAVRRADVVHAHGDAATLLALPLLARRASVWTTHGLHLWRRRPQIAGGVRLALGATRATLCTSQAEHDELIALAPGRAVRLVLARNGLAAAPAPDAALRAAVRAELGLADGEVAALFLGALEPRKGPLEAARAARAARAQGTPLTLLVAGAGELADATAHTGGEAVRMLGFREDPARLLAAADVFLLPSAREGLSFAILEAMQAGLACIVADGPGNPEAVGEAGLVVPAGDAAALTDALVRLAGDPAKRARLGAAARARVAAEFTVERLCGQVRDAYAGALTAPAPAAGA